MTVAIVTDSCSDMTPEQLREYDILQVPLTVFFGEEGALSPDELPPEAFWEKLTAPGAPLPHTAAPSAGQFKAAFEKLFAAGADEIVYVAMTETLSTTINSGRMAAQMLPDRTILTVDTRFACMGIGSLAIRASQLARGGMSGREIVDDLERVKSGLDAYVGLDTLEFLRRGGRISSAKAVVGGLLSIKPIIRVTDAQVILCEQVRTRGRAWERVLELVSERPIQRVHVVYAPPVDPQVWTEAILARLPGPPPELVTTQLFGPVIGTHVGPGAYGAVIFRQP